MSTGSFSNFDSQASKTISRLPINYSINENALEMNIHGKVKFDIRIQNSF